MLNRHLNIFKIFLQELKDHFQHEYEIFLYYVF